MWIRRKPRDVGPPRISVETEPGGAAVLRFSGRLTLDVAGEVWERARAVLCDACGPVRLDLSAVDVIDGGTAALLLAANRELAARGIVGRITGASERVRAMLDLVEPTSTTPATASPRPGLLVRVGTATAGLGEVALEALDFLGDAARATRAAVLRPRSVDWRTIVGVATRAGADGVPTIALLAFLVGLIIGFHGVVQGERYGATIYVPTGVALTVTRELGPLICAIVVAGRTGSAIAAEIGTMNVSEEIDALRTMGLPPHPFLVIPRVIALVVVVPLLAVIADIAGVLGGLFVWLVMLDLESATYLGQVRTYVVPWDLQQGILKSFFFGAAIASIACQRGLSARGGAEGVGRATTSAVVASIFAIVVLDSLATLIFITWERR